MGAYSWPSVYEPSSVNSRSAPDPSPITTCTAVGLGRSVLLILLNTAHYAHYGVKDLFQELTRQVLSLIPLLKLTKRALAEV